MSGEKSNIEIILDHLIEQQDKNNNNLNSRLDRLTEMLDKLQSHHIIVPQLENKILIIEKNYVDLKDTLQKLVYESEKREDIKKSITNPLIMRTLWSSMGIVACCLCVGVGFSYKTIDAKSKQEMQKLIKSQSH
jgi:DNA repair exonuclease SbcCD ATPase subunit